MLFQELGKLKRTSIMNSIVIAAIGIVMVICPERYTDVLVDVLGYALIVIAMTMTLDFIVSTKALINFITFTCALIMGILGLSVLIFNNHVVQILALAFGLYLIITGVGGIISALFYARRSQRKGWWFLLLLAGLLAFFGLIVLFNPWWNSPRSLLEVVGGMLLFSSVVSIVRLIFIWPIKDE